MCQKVELLSDTDLLSLLVGPRHAASLLKDASGSLSQLLHEPSPGVYAQPRVTSKLRAAAELVRRSLHEMMVRRDVLTSPAAVRSYLRALLANRDYEVFVVVFLDVQNHVIEVEEMFRGSLTQTSVYPREVVRRTLLLNAASVILAHNHPSGQAQPSRADENLTTTLRGALSLIDVRVLDHFIVGGNGSNCASFAELGLL